MDKQKKKIAEQILSWSEDEVAELLKLYDKKHITQHKKLFHQLIPLFLSLKKNRINCSRF